MTVYMPFRQFNGGKGLLARNLAVRTLGDPAPVMASLRGVVRDAKARLFAADIATMEQRVDATTAQPKLNALLLGGFAISILLLTALGLYSIAATYVRHREFEIAVRMALGAQSTQVVYLVLRQGLMVVLAGTAVGVFSAVAGAGLLRSVIFNVPARDPVMFAGALLLVGAVAVLAFLFPARRAARANPADVLRAG
jgi:ABC-type antimicrobial peptide transport system permease subunit